jgi:Xaa-Pro aminopeptidase
VLIPTNEYEERVERCQEFLRRSGLKALLGYSDHRFAMGQGVEVGQHMRYYAGFRFPPEEIHEAQVLLPYTRCVDIVVIPAVGEPALVMSRADENLVRRQTWMQDVRSVQGRHKDVERTKGLAATVKGVLHDHGILKGRIGIAGVGVTWELYEALVKVLPRSNFVSCSEKVDRLRMVKTENELRIMRRAAEIAEVGVQALLAAGKEGAAEYEVHQAAEKAMFDAGGDNPWTTIVSGPRAQLYSAFTRPDFTQRRLRSGDWLRADIGSEYLGYHSDVQPDTIIGQPSTQQMSLLRTEIKILRAMIEATRPGASEKDIVQAAVTASGGKLRMWYIGHGYGVGMDPPFLTERSLHKGRKDEVILKPNMIICYEPAVHIPGVGTSALEDEILVTENGCEVITNRVRDAEQFCSKWSSLGE